MKQHPRKGALRFVGNIYFHYKQERLMRIKEIGALVAIICLCILFSYPYHQGISPFDSGDYLKCAVNLLKGQWDTQNFYSHRIGTYAPMALAYKIFGFTPLLTWLTAFELVAFVVLLYTLLRKYNSYIAAFVAPTLYLESPIGALGVGTRISVSEI